MGNARNVELLIYSDRVKALWVAGGDDVYFDDIYLD